MVNKIRITNIKKNISVIIDANDSDDGNGFVLDSVDWDHPNGSLQTFRIPYQIGLSLLDIEVGTRAPVITGYIVADKEKRDGRLGQTWEEYYSEQLKNIEEKKLMLNKIVNMFQDLRVSVGEYYLQGRPTAPVIYGSAASENNTVLCHFTINVECANPMFRLSTEKKVSMSTVENMFVFPWFIKETGNVFGKIEKQSLVNVINNGDCDIGGIIVFKAINGNVTNPKVFNATTGEYIEVDMTINQGDTLTINTRFGEESITHYDQDAEGEKNKTAIMYVKEGSTFLQFRQGSWIYGYEVEEGTEVFVDMEINMDEQYYNIKEQ